MALNTLGDDTVAISMAGVASHRGVLALVGFELLILRDVAGQTDGLEFALEGDLQRLMGIVAALAVLDLIVRFAAMTHAALGDVVGNLGAMAGVAVLAVDLIAVLGAIGGNLGRLLVVALGAIRSAQRGLGRSLSLNRRCQPQGKTQSCHNQTGQNSQPFTSYSLHLSSLSDISRMDV